MTAYPEALQRAMALREKGEREREHDPDVAREHYEEAVNLLRTVDEPRKLAHTIRHLGDVHQDAGRPALAQNCYLEALEIYRRLKGVHPVELANAIRSLAVLRSEAGQCEAAVQLWREALDLYESSAVAAGVAESAARLALLVAQAGSPSAGQRWLRRASSAARESGDPGSIQYVDRVSRRLSERGPGGSRRD